MIVRTTPPWYRQGWPWGLIAAPLASVALGVVMLALALRSDDGLVVDDYYKRGLAINQVLARESRAAELGVAATVAFNPGRDRVRLAFAHDPARRGGAILRLVHPTRAGRDQVIALAPTQSGVLEGALTPPAPGRWRLVLEDGAGEWRLAGTWRTGEALATLAPSLPDGGPSREGGQ